MKPHQLARERNRKRRGDYHYEQMLRSYESKCGAVRSYFDPEYANKFKQLRPLNQ